MNQVVKTLLLIVIATGIGTLAQQMLLTQQSTALDWGIIMIGLLVSEYLIWSTPWIYAEGSSAPIRMVINIYVFSLPATWWQLGASPDVTFLDMLPVALQIGAIGVVALSMAMFVHWFFESLYKQEALE